MVDFSSLKKLLSGTILLRSEDKRAYQEEIDAYWTRVVSSCAPEAFVLAANVEDVVNTVKFCVQNKLELCVCAAKNSEFSIANGAVVLDLCLMKSVKVDAENKVAVVGGGAKLQDVDAETVSHCLVTPLGSYSELGVAGFTLLGGTGFLSRSYGCTVDNVLEFEIVTASGDVIKASEVQNPELFWGMKGYGANFGVVTSFKFQLFDIEEFVIGGELSYSMNKAKDVYKTIRDFVRDKADNRIAVYMIVHFSPTGPEALCRFLFNGPPRTGENLVEEMCDKTNPKVKKVRPIKFDEFQKAGDILVPRGKLYYTPMGSFVRELTDEGIDIIIDASNQSPDPSVVANSNIYITTLGGKIQDFPEDSSCYPFRPAEYWVGVVAATTEKDSYETIKAWANGIDTKMAKFGVFPQGPAAEKTQKRLKALKQKYDPSNFFHYNFNIDPNA